jgi:asparagine synthase (glutamine-hydrolysing)
MGLPDADIASFYPVFRQNMSPNTIGSFMQKPVMVSGITEQLISEKSAMQKYDTLSQYSIAEYMGYSSSTLLKDADQMSMAVGLEIREPFFDYRLVEYMLGLPNECKMNATPKQLLADVMEPLLPKEITSRKKKGFVLPWKHWMQNELFSFCESQLIEFANREFVQKQNLFTYWKRFIKNDPNIRWIELWQFVVLNYWMNKNSIEYKA